jgi:hypothetical protein
MNPFNSVQHVDSHIKYVLESLRALAQQPD